MESLVKLEPQIERKECESPGSNDVIEEDNQPSSSLAFSSPASQMYNSRSDSEDSTGDVTINSRPSEHTLLDVVDIDSSEEEEEENDDNQIEAPRRSGLRQPKKRKFFQVKTRSVQQN